mgnify:CR=1 FL=1
MEANFDINSALEFHGKVESLKEARRVLGWDSIHAIYVSERAHLGMPCGIAPSEFQARHWMTRVNDFSGATYISVNIDSQNQITTTIHPDPRTEVAAER